MKKILFILFIAVALTGCYKRGSQIGQDPPAQPPTQTPPKAEIRIITTGLDYYGKTTTGYETSKLISAPSGTGKVILKYSEVNDSKVKDVKWFINDVNIGAGNDVEVTFDNFGDRKLKVTYKDAVTGSEYTKELTLRVHKYVVADFKFSNLDICGDLNIAAGISNTRVNVDCSKGTAEIENMVFPISDFNNVFIIFFLRGFWPVKAITIPGSSLNNFAPGTYTVDGTTVTIVK